MNGPTLNWDAGDHATNDELIRDSPAGRQSGGRPRRWRLLVASRRRVRPVGIVDARTHLEHLVPDDVLATPRLSYLAKCGAEVLAASLTDPGRGRCRECAR